MQRISDLGSKLPTSGIGERRVAEGSGAATQGGFADVLVGAVTEAGRAERAAGSAATAFQKGEGSVHEVMIAQEKASIALRFALTMKNRALEAYRELMNTPV